jgi:hypothetical protein
MTIRERTHGKQSRVSRDPIPLFFLSDNPGHFNLFPIQDSDAWVMCVLQEIDLSADRSNYQGLLVISPVLTFYATADGIISLGGPVTRPKSPLLLPLLDHNGECSRRDLLLSAD